MVLYRNTSNNAFADVAELADALDLGSSSERSAGSIPVSPTHLGQASLFGDSLESRNSHSDFLVIPNDF